MRSKFFFKIKLSEFSLPIYWQYKSKNIYYAKENGLSYVNCKTWDKLENTSDFMKTYYANIQDQVHGILY